MNNPFEIIDARLSNIETMLIALKSTSPESKIETVTEEFLTVQETAKFLSLSVPTVYGLISRKQVPVMKRSKRCYFSKVDLMTYLKAGRKATQSEIESAVSQSLGKKKS